MMGPWQHLHPIRPDLAMPELPEVAALADFLDTHLRGAVAGEGPDRLLRGAQDGGSPRLRAGGPDRDRRAPAREVRRTWTPTGCIWFSTWPGPAGSASPTRPPATPLKMGSGHLAARLSFSSGPGPLDLDLTEAGTKKSLAVYVVRDPSDVPGIAALGPDPFSPGFDVDALAGILAASNQQIKGVLRSQGVIAGIGNAYSDEILHAARMSPFAIARSLDRDAVQRLYDAIHEVLGTALAEAGGKPPSELKDTKRSHMRVHGRAGEACPVCGDTVREVSFADTALQYCPGCQTKGKILADRRTSRFLK